MIHLAVVADGRNLILIKHFIDWYKPRVDKMHFTINCDDSQPAIDLLKSEGIEPAFIWTDEYQTRGLRAYRDRMRLECVPNDEWCITVDCDEFQNWYPKDHLKGDYNLATGIMVDMLHPSGVCMPMQSFPSLEEQYPRKCFATQKIGKSWICKIAAMKGRELEVFGEGGGYTYIHPKCSVNTVPKIVEILHFKWDDTTLNRMQERADRYKRLGIEWHGLSKNLVDYLEEHGRIRFEDCETPDWDFVDPQMLIKQYGEMYDGSQSLYQRWQSYC